MNDLTIDTEWLLRDIEALATFVEPGVEGRTRRAFTPAFVEGRRWLEKIMWEAGLTVSLDAAANLVGRRAGRADLPPLVIGSHTDTVPNPGRLDGMLGVLAGVAIARALAQAGQGLRHPLEVIDFLAEEPTPFGCCIGSMALAGALPADAPGRADASGRTLAEALRFVGGRPGELAGVARAPGAIAAYLELHIEQGRVLEDWGAPIGVVRGIVGIRRAALLFGGRPDHAGTTPMRLRHDALAAAAEVVLAVERIAREAGDAVGTVGALEVSPNQSNVIPGAVNLVIELRHLDWPTVERLWAEVYAAAAAACAARGVALGVGPFEDMPPMQSPGWLTDTLAAAAEHVAPGAPHLASGAGHDGSWVGRVAPAGMLFVRSRDGRSHCPEEHSAPEDIALGVAALARALLSLDTQLAENASLQPRT